MAESGNTFQRAYHVHCPSCGAINKAIDPRLDMEPYKVTTNIVYVVYAPTGDVM